MLYKNSLGRVRKQFVFLTCLCAFLFSFSFGIGVAAGQGEEPEYPSEKKQIGNFSFQIINKQTVHKKLITPLKNSTILCGASASKNVANNFEQSFSMNIDRELLQEVSAGLGLGLDINVVDIKLGLRNKLAETFKFSKTYTKKTAVAQKHTLAPLECYDQSMGSIDAVYRYTARIIIPVMWGMWGTTKEFSWEEPDNLGSIVYAKYGGASCHDKCIVSGDQIPAKNDDGDELNIEVRYKHETIYIVPLYWKKEGDGKRVINILELLPDGVSNDVGGIRIQSILGAK